MFGLGLLGCVICGAIIGYSAADAIEADNETTRIIEDMNQCIDEMEHSLDEREKLIEYTEEEIEKILSETDEVFKESVRNALEAGVEAGRLIKNKEDCDKLFG